MPKLPFAPIAELFGEARVKDLLERCRRYYDLHIERVEIAEAAETMKAVIHWESELAKFHPRSLNVHS